MTAIIKRPIEQRLMDRVAVVGSCREFDGCRSRDGYGLIKVAGHMKRAHRMVYELAKGPIPDGMVVMHRCDNRACINPAHLQLGSVADNNRDTLRKGRMRGLDTVAEFQRAKTHLPQGAHVFGQQRSLPPIRRADLRDL
jgi:hypothetical protein